MLDDLNVYVNLTDKDSVPKENNIACTNETGVCMGENGDSINDNKRGNNGMRMVREWYDCYRGLWTNIRTVN